jgi:hypothetical protein
LLRSLLCAAPRSLQNKDNALSKASVCASHGSPGAAKMWLLKELLLAVLLLLLLLVFETI